MTLSNSIIISNILDELYLEKVAQRSYNGSTHTCTSHRGCSRRRRRICPGNRVRYQAAVRRLCGPPGISWCTQRKVLPWRMLGLPLAGESPRAPAEERRREPASLSAKDDGKIRSYLCIIAVRRPSRDIQLASYATYNAARCFCFSCSLSLTAAERTGVLSLSDEWSY